MKHQLKKIANQLVESYFRYRQYQHYSNQFRMYLKRLGLNSGIKADGEDEYVKKWDVFNNRVEPYSYRLFCRYVGSNPNIVPEDIGRLFIEPVLNPLSTREYYEDKNMFPIVLGKDAVPVTRICRIGGGLLLDGNYNPLRGDISNYLGGGKKLILKPSVGSSSGIGVMMFVEDNGIYTSVDRSVKLTMQFLQSYSKDFVLQDAVEQHPDLSLYNPTSVNTLRLAVYKSVIDDEPHVTASIMRVGKNGSFIDNAHAGGVCVGIEPNTGKVSDKLYDQFGNTFYQWNGLDYKKAGKIPCWNEILNFAYRISKSIKHHRLLALDLSVTNQGKPILIEYNIRGFSYWLFQYCGQVPFGEFTEEIIDYCLKHKKKYE